MSHSSFSKDFGLVMPNEREVPYSYASSSESNSPYTPVHDPTSYDSFPCPPSQCLPDIHCQEQSLNTAWGAPETYSNYAADMSLAYKAAPTITFSAGLPLHAPVPLPGHSSLLFSEAQSLDFPLRSCESPRQILPPFGCNAEIASRSEPETRRTFLAFDQYATAVQPTTFPTPSELLVGLTSQGAPAHYALPQGETKSKTGRGARQHTIAKSVGFEPTDPNSLSSHEGKRQYLECLEQYVMYLHHQFSLVGSEPVPLKRVPSYPGLHSRSIRTLLVHMQDTTRKLKLRTVGEEQRFLMLQDAVQKQTAIGAYGYEHRHTTSPSPLAAEDKVSAYF